MISKLGICTIFLLIILVANLSGRHSLACAENFMIREVKAGDNLYRMCVKQYGKKCSDKLIRSITDLNPWLRNPDFIKKGDRIKFPTFLGEEVDVAPAVVSTSSDGLSAQQKPPVTLSDLSLSPRVTGMERPEKYDHYPDILVGEINHLKWLSDNTAMVTGAINRPQDVGCVFTFVVSVDGDLDYPQELRIGADGKFVAFTSIGRSYDDYGKTFTLKLIKEQSDRQVSQIAVTIVKEKNRAGSINFNTQQNFTRIVGVAGIEKWIKAQSVDSKQLDNIKFKSEDGMVIRNYRFINFNQDEKYLGRYGRVTLYGSSTIAKYLILKGDQQSAKKILDVWCNLLDEYGGVPRSANVVGDTYISPDVRTGDMAYFLGALVLYKAETANDEYDEIIRKLLHNYFKKLQDSQTGLVRGGYSSASNGYTDSGSIKHVSWASAEHNFDLFQSLVLLSRLVSAGDKASVTEMYTRIGKGLDTYMWNKETNTFNRGYRFENGSDQAKALDCSSWGALYLLKQAALAVESKDYDSENFYMRRAATSLDFIDKNFKAKWCYTAQDGKHGCITGYKPYAGKIDDVQDDSTHVPIDWDKITDMVWSEGTLGVAIAHYQMWCQKSLGIDLKNCERFYDLLDQMEELQSLGQTGGLLYTSKRIEGHFTQGEELASLAWLGYALIIKGREYTPSILKYQKWIPW